MDIKKNVTGAFTIIELLVVVAIVSVLTGIVLVNVTGYMNKGKNAAIKGSLDSLYKNAVIYYDANSVYTVWPDPVYPGFFASLQAPPISGIGAYYGDDAGYVPSQPLTKWCFCIALKAADDVPANSTYCVDSSGYKKQTTTQCLLTRCKMVGFVPPAQAGYCTD